MMKLLSISVNTPDMVDRVECELYKGHIGNMGYGLDYDPETQKTILAHRKAFKDYYGSIDEGLVVMHICNNKACVNPLHLKQGTQSENVKQSYKDGLQINPNRKCDKKTVLAIYHSSLSTRKLAKHYGLTQTIVQKIKQGLTYRDWTNCGV